MPRCARLLLPFILVLTCAILPTAAPFSGLRVAENNRYLETTNGDPFLYLGDTAWELFHRLNREEAVRYLDDRAGKGFTVIQAVVLAQIGDLKDPNPYGNLPLVDRDPTQPNEAYFEHVDFIVDEAEKRGLVVGMLPTWGTYWVFPAGNERTVFTPENARIFGTFLGERYRDKPIIWILGGDANITGASTRAIIDAMADGLSEGDGGRHLITFHPRGPGLSSDQVHNAEWLDFNMVQTSHAARTHDTGLFIDHDLSLSPLKPTLDGEPRYEGIYPFYFDGYSDIVRFTDDDVRRAAYMAMMAGACGHTYGNNNIWQMWQPGRGSIIGANIPWYEALNHPGAQQMKYLGRLFRHYPFDRLLPAQDIIVDGPLRGTAKIRALRADDKSFLFVYTPEGEPFTLDQNILGSRPIRETWYDPRYGVSYVLHRTGSPGFQTYTPPTSGYGQDWVLIVDDHTEYDGVPNPD